MSGDDPTRRLVSVACLGCLCVASVAAIGCGGTGRHAPSLTAEKPLHLEEHLDVATLEGAEIPGDVLAPLEWQFDSAQPTWKPVKPTRRELKAVAPVQVDGALRLAIDSATGSLGAIYVELDSVDIADWGHVEIRARSHPGMRNLGLGFNDEEGSSGPLASFKPGDRAPLVSDGSVQTYRLLLDSPYMSGWKGPWRHLAVWFSASGDEDGAALDLLSVRLVPREAEFAAERAGVRLVGIGVADVSSSGTPYRRALYMHAPGTVSYEVRVPELGRLDTGLGVLQPGEPVTFRVSVERESGVPELLLEEKYGGGDGWLERSVDLAHLTGKMVRLSLETDAERQGAVAFWATPTLSGARSVDLPNVIFYVVDGAGAEHMSVYGYNRDTTPNLARLASEGTLFEHAYSNADWTKPSTMSFMTSLHHSVLGGHRGNTDRLPAQAKTMAEYLHEAGYQTAVLVSNSYAGRLSGLERGADVLRDFDLDSNSESSAGLHESFWRWRDAFPGEPYWVHFQTTDVHYPHDPPPPFAGLFIDPARSRAYPVWNRDKRKTGVNMWDDNFKEKIGIRYLEYADASRGLYDETMAHQDHQIGRLVDRLKASGEWGHTLLIVASDHGVVAAAGNQVDTGLLDPFPAQWLVYNGGRFRPPLTKIPLLFVWPERIPGGLRLSNPVSMIDVLPTILDLAGVSTSGVLQGQSLAPLLLGTGEWEDEPVIFDQFNVDPQTGELRGTIDVVDGRWGASLEINPDPDQEPEQRRPAPLLLFDLWADPDCWTSVHGEHPDLVERYTALLEERWEAHRVLAGQFSQEELSPLNPEQLETLRSLGYIQ